MGNSGSTSSTPPPLQQQQHHQHYPHYHPHHHLHHHPPCDDHHLGEWTQSFPRAPYQHKLVVPDRDAHQRLRPTGNGEILHAGGTISGRRHEWGGVSRSSSIPAVRQQQQQEQQPKGRSPYRHNQPRVLTPSYRKDQMKRFGSEPDLRGGGNAPANSGEYDRFRARKKYKAPAPPSQTPLNHAHQQPAFGIETGSPMRRARLFKTRAETKNKKPSSPVHNRRPLAQYKSSETLANTTRQHQQAQQAFDSRSSTVSNNSDGNILKRPAGMPPMQRTQSSPEFQAELKQVTRRLVDLRRDNDNKLKTLDHNINKKDLLRNKLKEIKTSRDMMLEERSPASGKESTPELSPPKVKTFYFGMAEEDVEATMAPEQLPIAKIPNSVGSDVCSSSGGESDPETTNDISLQLRPILPKKQLEIPRFSPAAAWKLLSAVDPAANADSTLASEEGSVYQEDRIEKDARPPPPYRLPLGGGQRSNPDRSGDSGISGDETPEALLPSAPSPPKQRGISWTPQQDLGDDSSLDDATGNLLLDFPDKFATRPHVFSLSLPRDNHLAAYINEKNFLQPYSSLQKLKRSMSGVLGTFTKEGEPEPQVTDPQSPPQQQESGENWFLSRSAPNSLNNGFNSLEMRRPYRLDMDFEAPKQTRRIMYLPQSNLENTIKKKHLSKSYENIARVEKKEKPQDLQDPPKVEDTAMALKAAAKWTKKPKKFTFQSTVRQIERKRLADRLSKEAERKEQQRLRELEAMQRVEEEFQKKRAREKATIRQQLRLYSMDETAWSSLPPNLDLSEEIRAEPDGAVSSSTSSPTLKKNLATSSSEFRQSQREYKEFRSGRGACKNAQSNVLVTQR